MSDTKFNIFQCYSSEKEILMDKNNNIMYLNELEALKLSNKLNIESLFSKKITKGKLTFVYIVEQVE